jgi:cytidylate kinase
MAILTISRQLGSFNKEIPQTMARLWKYEYVDRRKILEDMDAQGDRWGVFGKEFDEHYPNLWERFDRSFTGFVVLSQSIILNYALKDNVIIVGRGGNYLLREVPYALNVRIVAPMEQRLEEIMKRESLSRSAAELFVKKVDKEMSRAVHFIYGRNIDDPSAYDLFFDVGVLPVHDIMGAIRAALLEKDKLKTEEALRALEMKALAKKVRAGIVTHPKLFIPVFDVLPGNNRLLVTGIVHNPAERKKVEEAVKELTGMIRVEFALHYR